MSASPQLEGNALRVVLLTVLVAGIVTGGALGGVGLLAILLTGTAWAFWAGSLVWSDSYGPADHAVRAGLVALYPATLAGIAAAFYASSLTWLPAQPFVIAPQWVAVAATAGGPLALLVLWIRARRSSDPEETVEAEGFSPAGAYAAVVATTALLVGLSTSLFFDAPLLIGFVVGLVASFPVAIVQGLTHLCLARRTSRRRLVVALVLPWLLVSSASLLAVLYLNQPTTIWRQHLGARPDSVRDLRVETIRRDFFDHMQEVSFEIDAADLRRVIARNRFEPTDQVPGEPVRAWLVLHDDYVTELTLAPSGRVTLKWRCMSGFP